MKTLLKMRSWTAVLFLMSAAACTAKPPADYGSAPPEINLTGVGLRMFRGSELRALGQANTATYQRNTGDLTAHQVKLKILRANDTDIDLASALVVGNTRTQQALASDGVRLTDNTGTVGTTQQAHFDGRERRAFGDNPVTIVGIKYQTRSAAGFELGLANPGWLALQGPVITNIGGH